ncbi:MAG: helix-turn-helix domain-containing protein, partial [Coriobacteriales bacterium]|nr:helix-turn-helix domain-containing protein [Coriobacteriales bacterium]
MITTGEAARRLDISKRRVVALIESGDLTAQRFGHVWMVDESSVASRLEQPRLTGRPKLGERDQSKLLRFTLMNKNYEVLNFTYNSRNHTVGEVQPLGKMAYAPLGILSSPGHPTTAHATEWIANRYIPTIRPRLTEFLRELGYNHPAQMMFASFGLNLSDQYWFRPEGASLNWH